VTLPLLPDAGLGGQADPEGELAAVVVHAAAVHQAQDVPHRLRRQHLLSGCGADSAVGCTHRLSMYDCTYTCVVAVYIRHGICLVADSSKSCTVDKYLSTRGMYHRFKQFKEEGEEDPICVSYTPYIQQN
jgi:hypothetical protein